jgi:malonyl-CoA/methylmalonyl-CoA synthetase
MAFLDELRATFADRAAHTALEYRGRAYSYGELESLVGGGAATLRRLGMAPGDRVAVSTADRLAFLVAHLAVLLGGGVSLPLNPRFTREEMRHFLADSAARVVVADTDRLPTLESLRSALSELQSLVTAAEIASAPPRPLSDIPTSPDDSCLILYSSGTTGWPKGVVHTSANLGTSLRGLQACWRVTDDDAVLHVLPLFHIHGLSFAAHLTLLAGGRLLLEDSFDPTRTLEAARRATAFMAVPTIYYRLLDEPGFRDAARGLSGVRLFTCGSAPIRPEVLPALEEILGRPVINRYGMTEAHVIASLPLDGPWPWGSVGLPLPGIELQVVDAGGRPVRVGEVGAVRLCGPNLFREYWRNRQATAKAFAGCWFDTGDLGSLDANGFLTLAGRSTELIITSGYNVYPQVVERVLNACPGVRESAVFGVPDAMRGEAVAAAVVRADPDLDESQLRGFVAERLVDYQRPRVILFVEALPRNAMGKVPSGELRRLVPPERREDGGR